MVFTECMSDFTQKYKGVKRSPERCPRSPLPTGGKVQPSPIQETQQPKVYSEYRNKDAGSKYKQETIDNCTLTRAIAYARERNFRIVIKLDNGKWYFKGHKTPSKKCTPDEKLHDQLKNSSKDDYNHGDCTAYFIHL